MLTLKIFTVRALTRLCAWMLVMLLVPAAAHAALTIIGTRVIYDEAQGEASVHISHTAGDDAALMQTWMDDGDPQSQPGQQTVPFILNPAVALLEPGAAQVVRVLRIGELPSDKESLFFFNVLEVPPDASDKLAAGESFVQFAMQARLKFFYRPRGLQPSVVRAPDLLRFSGNTGADGRMRVRISNPTPYHMTFTDLALHASDADNAPMLAELDTRSDLAPMIAPGSELDVVLKPAGGGQVRGVAQITPQTRVRYALVNDQGGKNIKQAKLD